MLNSRNGERSERNSEKARENPANDRYACRTKRGDNVPGETPPNGAYGAIKVETSQGLGLASPNINFYQQT